MMGPLEESEMRPATPERALAADALDECLRALCSPALAPLFWRPARAGAESAWWGHVPFAHWLVSGLRPGVIVELGTHTGVSYCAMCEAVMLAKIDARCYAVDTWGGDDHSGHYGDEVYWELRQFHDSRYGAFSELLRTDFDTALQSFSDGSVDLLHIDGLHTYEAVEHDFESWRPKLSERGVVVLHDINVRTGDFGVWMLWEALRDRFPSFELLHGYGLGLVAIGPEVPQSVADLCTLQDPSAISALRERFATLGERWVANARERIMGTVLAQRDGRIAEVETVLSERDRRLAELETALGASDLRSQEVGAELSACKQDVGQLNAELRAWDARIQEALAASAAERRLRARAAERAVNARRALHAAQEAAVEKSKAEVGTLRKRLAQVALERDEVLHSTFWRSTRPLRSAVSHLPPSSRESAARVFRIAWWAATLQLPRRLRDRRRLNSDLNALRESRLFQPQWYLERYPDVAERGVDPALHYLLRGALEDRDPGPEFSSTAYLRHYEDVAKAGVNPLLHYLRRGQAEGRLAFPSAVYPADHSAPASPAPKPTTGLGAQQVAPVIIYVSGEPDTPGNSYRVTRYVEAAGRVGASASWIRLAEVTSSLGSIADADVLVLWRTAWDERVDAAISAARRGGAKIVFDVDDLMFEPQLARTSIIDGIRTQGLTEDQVSGHYARVRETMMAADICTATTQELASYMRAALKPVFVLPNGFDLATLQASRRLVRQRRAATPDGLFRIGYAGGSRTHQRDFNVAVPALSRVLRERPETRLVLFRNCLDIEEYPDLAGLQQQVEWRDLVPLARLPEEIARFDVNLAPLEVGNPFCEAKSELKFFEAALVDVVTVASPTGPFQRAIRHGKTGFLADSAAAWYAAILQLAAEPTLRRRMVRSARLDAMRLFGPLCRSQALAGFLAQLRGGQEGARAFALAARLSSLTPAALPRIPEAGLEFHSDRLGDAEVTVIVPLHNYAKLVTEALDSVRAQTLEALDLVVVDDASTDKSLSVALEWARANAPRFNRILVLRNLTNAGLGFTRNVGFDVAETPYVLPLDADNRLRPACCETLLSALRHSDAAFAYPLIQEFGDRTGLMGSWSYDPQRLVGFNYIDAMALVAKEAWAAGGGYDHVRFGWEDYDFWCRLAELGHRGVNVPEPLAEYRVHGSSMIRATTTQPENMRLLIRDISRRHPWLAPVNWVKDAVPEVAAAQPGAIPDGLGASDRLKDLVPMLRCPETGLPLVLADDGSSLRTADGTRTWPVLYGRPVLFPGMLSPKVMPDSHVSNDLPESAVTLIRETRGLVLNLSGGGTKDRFDNVLEAEAAIFRHTDVVADSHHLPFADESFEAVIALNAFEHYRDPRRAALEIRRVLRPGGRVLIQTAFLQPQHEAPWHFFNCTRYGLEVWFEGFERERLHVSDNFTANYSLSWLASECEAALLRDVSPSAAEAFATAPTGHFVRFWRDPTTRDSPLWTDLRGLSETSQEAIAAGFEYVGRKPII